MLIVTADSLLRGAWYSLEQSGLLLGVAVEAYNRGRLATAVALALLASVGAPFLDPAAIKLQRTRMNEAEAKAWSTVNRAG